MSVGLLQKGDSCSRELKTGASDRAGFGAGLAGMEALDRILTLLARPSVRTAFERVAAEPLVDLGTVQASDAITRSASFRSE
jgi:hypothetical protein